MKKLVKIEKMWRDGEALYDGFASQFGFKYSTPRTIKLELFACLKEAKEKELLLREMMTEFLENLSDEEIIIQNNELFSVSKKLTRISPQTRSLVRR